VFSKAFPSLITAFKDFLKRTSSFLITHLAHSRMIIVAKVILVFGLIESGPAPLAERNAP
jgi:hypothetical protein